MLPLRALADGVARLARGDLNVSIAPSSRDEFASLTDAFNRMVMKVAEMLAARGASCSLTSATSCDRQSPE